LLPVIHRGGSLIKLMWLGFKDHVSTFYLYLARDYINLSSIIDEINFSPRTNALVSFYVEAIMSDSESEAPETLNLAQTAQSARGREREIRHFAAAERQKTKERNRLRDERLKKQASVKKAKKSSSKNTARAEDPDEETRRLEARMKRAMDEADDEDEDSEDGDYDTGKMDFAGSEGMEDSDDDGDDSDEGAEDYDMDVEGGDVSSDMKDEAEEEDDGDGISALKSGYLPDHLFASAFSKTPAPRSKEKSSKPVKKTKHKRASRKNKDMVIG
jgi:hypothetical protein